MSGDEPAAASETFWRVERRGAALVAILDRPTVRNALNFACWEQLERIIGRVEGDSAIRALVLAGAGGVFSAGGDMKNPEPRGDGLMKGAARLRFLQTVLARLAGLSAPSIAAVEGPAVGVAWGLALTCDFVIAARDAKFMAPFLSRTLAPDGGVAYHLVRALGRLRATEILLGNRTLSGSEAFDAGLVSEITAPGEALERALAIAEAVARCSRDTTALTLRALRRAEQSGYRDYLDAELELAALNLHNPDVAAGRMSFKKAAAPSAGKERRS
jgi:enoyl-CoA hydratase/carnithine racemase